MHQYRTLRMKCADNGTNPLAVIETLDIDKYGQYPFRPNFDE